LFLCLRVLEKIAKMWQFVRKPKALKQQGATEDIEMIHLNPPTRPGVSARPFVLRLTLGCGLLTLIAACDKPLDFDLRSSENGFTTAGAAQKPTAERPEPDDRGVISYPNYQVAVARQGDTLNDVATRVGADPTKLASFNGISPEVPLRAGEIIALPTRVAEPSAATGAVQPGGVDITTLASNAIDSSSSPLVRTTTLEPASSAPKVTSTQEPVRHQVQRGETAYTIARLYKVPVQNLAEWNGLGSDFAVREDQFLLIPVARQAPPKLIAATPAPGAGSPTPTPPSATEPLPAEKLAPASTPAPKPDVDIGKTTGATTAAAMAMPVQGNIIREYSKGKNDGIDISGSAGAPVKAAANGTVAAITSDENQVPIVVVRHPDNLLTVYANITDIAVKKGDKVKRGQTLAKLRSGKDAYAHFEVRKGFDSVDPIPYLR
jgi:murein DD-endopeptidase MepM/ murein hydrolase activator NlpD